MATPLILNFVPRSINREHGSHDRLIVNLILVPQQPENVNPNDRPDDASRYLAKH
jgi:hypothetical protein